MLPLLPLIFKLIEILLFHDSGRDSCRLLLQPDNGKLVSDQSICEQRYCQTAEFFKMMKGGSET
jgi:hypothetical protein